MSSRQTASSGRPWEDQCGYSRAVRVGNFIEVSATAPSLPDGSMFSPGDVSAQVRHCFGIIEKALVELGASLEDVVKNTIYLDSKDEWEKVADVHRELFNEIRPCITFVFTNGWPIGETGVEIETTAYVDE